MFKGVSNSLERRSRARALKPDPAPLTKWERSQIKITSVEPGPQQAFKRLMYATKYSTRELKEVLKSQAFKDFAATYPRQSEWSRWPKPPQDT